VLVLRLSYFCDPTKLRRFFEQILQRMYKVLLDDSMLYPEIVGACVDLVDIIVRDFDAQSFLHDTAFLSFVKEMLPQIEPFQDVHQSISLCLFRIEQKAAAQ
jgi:hypothetical protein